MPKQPAYCEICTQVTRIYKKHQTKHKYQLNEFYQNKYSKYDFLKVQG